MEFFKAQIKAVDKATARNVLGKMKSGDITELHLPVVPKEAVEQFLAGKRPNLWNIMIDDEVAFEVVADKKSAQAILEMIKHYEKEELPLAPILQTNLQEFVSGKRKDIAMLEIANKEPGEELPGHVT